MGKRSTNDGSFLNITLKLKISFLSKKREAITTDFANWYQNEVFLKLNPSLNRDSWSDNWKIVEHVQEALRRVFQMMICSRLFSQMKAIGKLTKMLRFRRCIRFSGTFNVDSQRRSEVENDMCTRDS